MEGVPYPDMPTKAYSNFPPLPSQNFADDLADQSAWPMWLKDLYMSKPDKAILAMDPANWNRILGEVNADKPLGDKEKIVQAALLFKTFSPSQGWVPINPDFEFTVTGANAISIGGQSNLFPGTQTWRSTGISFAGGPSPLRSTLWGGRHYGGHGGFRSLMIAAEKGPRGNSRMAAFDVGAPSNEDQLYPWISKPFKITVDPTGLITGGFSAADLIIEISANVAKASLPTAAQEGNVVVQTIKIDMGKLPTDMPSPSLAAGARERIDEWGDLNPPETSPGRYWSLSSQSAFQFGKDGANAGRLTDIRHSSSTLSRFIKEGDVCWSMGVPHGDYRLVAARRNDAGELFEPHPLASKGRMAHTFYTGDGGHFAGSGRAEGQKDITATNQLVQGVPYKHGPSPLWGDSSQWNKYGDFDNGMGNAQDGPYINKADEGNTHSLNRVLAGEAPKNAYDFKRDFGDFPYFVREYVHEPGGPSFFSPSRIMPGPGVFGSLPTGVINPPSGGNQGAWQTLLFRPDVGGQNHPGAASPKDHLIMDLFWMPVVEPYAISETLSTAGKVNMNYQILPFSYITRNTALRGVFQSEVMMTVPNAHAKDYKTGSGRGDGYHWKYNKNGGTLQQKSMRSLIVMDETLQQFETEYFDKNKIFKSATEICDIHLVPIDISEAGGYSGGSGMGQPSVSAMENGSHQSKIAVTGDNARERPYTDIYPRLTTKSNTFKVHFRAQVLRKFKGQPVDEWDPEYDQAVGEYRGSTVIERYLDPKDTIPDYATDAAADAVDKFYRYRVLNTRRFAP